MDQLPTQTDPNAPKPHRKYKKLVTLTIPEIPRPPPLADSPEYCRVSTSSSPQTPQISPTVLHLIEEHGGAGITLSKSTSPSTPDSASSLLEPFTHQQTLKPHLSQFDHVDLVLKSCQEHFDTLADFFDTLFEKPPKSAPDPCTSCHRNMLRSFLQGKNTVKPIAIIEKIYNNRYSYPSYRSVSVHEQSLSFDPNVSPSDIGYARPAMSSRALRLVGNCAYKEIASVSTQRYPAGSSRCLDKRSYSS